MLEITHCPGCGTLLETPQDGLRGIGCPQCGSLLLPSSNDYNPYSPPTSSLRDQVDEQDYDSTYIPPGVFGKFGLAFRLLFGNLGLFIPIVLTIWLPANLIIESMESAAIPGQEGMATMRMSQITQGIFGPIVFGAVITSLSRLIHGQSIGYFEAIGAGFQNWGRLFVANFVAGLIIILAMLALIVPGIIMQIRYAFLDSVVVLEHASDPRARSTDLTRGRRWSIFWAYTLFFTVFLPVSYIIINYIAEFESPAQFAWNVGASCFFDVLGLILSIVLFLFYCEARQQEDASRIDSEGDILIKKRMSEFLGE